MFYIGQVHPKLGNGADINAYINHLAALPILKCPDNIQQKTGSPDGSLRMLNDSIYRRSHEIINFLKNINNTLT